MTRNCNLVFVFADQWRCQAFGYTGDPNVATPNIDNFASQSLNFANAVSGCPVCSPSSDARISCSMSKAMLPLCHPRCRNHTQEGADMKALA